MPDADGKLEGGDFGAPPAASGGFFLKGCDNLDWGMKNRLSRIFNPESGRTVMLAFDHGYCMGPTSGLERLDVTIPPLIDHADCLMCTRGALRTAIPATAPKPVALRVSAGNTILDPHVFETEVLGVSAEDAIRLNACALAVQVCIGAESETETIDNLVQVADVGMTYGIPILGVTAVGKQLTRDARYLGLATRVLAEIGATFVKSYYCEEGFEKVVAGCPVPIVIAGGKKLPERDALEMAYKAVSDGASGVDMGRNVFQAADPVAMIQAVRAVVHDGAKPDAAFDLYNDLVKG